VPSARKKYNSPFPAEARTIDEETVLGYSSDSDSNLTKSYGSRVAVNRLNLTVEAKQIHGFLGPNGAGKTTTIKMLVGLLTPDSGSLKILGMNAAGDKPKIRQRIGYMPELPKFQNT